MRHSGMDIWDELEQSVEAVQAAITILLARYGTPEGADILRHLARLTALQRQTIRKLRAAKHPES